MKVFNLVAILLSILLFIFSGCEPTEEDSTENSNSNSSTNNNPINNNTLNTNLGNNGITNSNENAENNSTVNGQTNQTSNSNNNSTNNSTINNQTNQTANSNDNSVNNSNNCLENQELCNGIDDNCNEEIDEGFNDLGQACTVGEGECQASGENVCKEDASGTVCNAEITVSGEEICDDGIDNNCDGHIDENCLLDVDTDTLNVDCNVPYVLDDSQASSVGYMTGHFGDLVQEYCIIGSVRGDDLNSYDEKMYFGTHPPNDNILSLMQSSMASIMSPTFSVKVNFWPDTAVTNGSKWAVTTAPEEGNALAIVLKHASRNDYCLYGIGYGGTLEFSNVNNVTSVEGGSYSVNGTMEIANPTEIPGICDIFEGLTSCCE